MCYVGCEEFGAWCRSFTRAEATLAAAQAALLSLLLAALVFLALHLPACALPPARRELNTTTPEDTTASAIATPHLVNESSHTEGWASSHKPTPDSPLGADATTADIAPAYDAYGDPEPSPVLEYDYMTVERSDGEDAGDSYREYSLALVKPEPRGDFTFGCILSVISQYWALTAASCVEAIEEVDSLDSFVMLEGYGEARPGRRLALADVRLHPRFRGAAPAPDLAYDAAALRSERALLRSARPPLRLPTFVDYFLLAIGERLVALGYGEYRTSRAGVGAGGRRLRRVAVFTAGAAACAAGAGEEEAWAPRHLVPMRALAGGACGARPLCAGALWARGAACAHCAGTPLVRPAAGAPPLLLGVMAANPRCGVDCEPRPYVNVVQLRDWLRALLGS